MPRLQKFENVAVELDGQAFDGCVFIGCDLIYRGGRVPDLSGCSFQSCEWRLLDSAGKTLVFFTRLHEIGATDVVEGFFAIAKETAILPEEPLN